MKPINLVEQRATYASSSFTFTDSVPGRVNFASAGLATSERLWYHATTDDKSQWEIGIATWNGSTAISRSTVYTSSTGSAVNFTAAVTVSIVAPAQSQISADATSETAASANGLNALAVGSGAQAWGTETLAIGRLALAGESGASKNSAIAIGYSATATHVGAVSIGEAATSVFDRAFHLGGTILWSSEGYTSDAATFEFGPLLLPLNRTFAFEAIVAGQRDPTVGAYGAIVRGLVRRGASGDAAFVGAPSVTEIAKTGGVTASADAYALTGGNFAVAVTGETGEDWYWHVSIRGVAV